MDKIKTWYTYGGALMGKEERGAWIKSFDKNWWAWGEEGAKMETEAAKYLNVKHAIITQSGSSAGLLALSALELPRGSEVIISACTFPTIFNIILQCGLCPVVVDAEIGSYTFNVKNVEKAITKKTKLIIAIHPVGNPVDMPALMRLARKYKILVMEDNCDGWGGSINGKKLGAWGDLSITSFHAAHIVAMGQGGGVFTNDSSLAKKVRQYRDWGRKQELEEQHNYPSIPSDYPSRFIYEKIGYNLFPIEPQAYIGRIQLKRISKIKKLRQRNFKLLVRGLRKYWHLLMPETVKGADVCWFALPLTYMGNRANLLEWLDEHGIETRPMFAGNITKHPAYLNSNYRISGELFGANWIMRSSFWIGVHPRYTKKGIEKVIKIFDEYFEAYHNNDNS